MPVKLVDDALEPVKADLHVVADRILEELADPVAKKVVYLITAGGKRLRPALVLLSGHTGPSPNREALLSTAMAVELIHTATLIHDDIIDQSALRRSQPTFHHRWGTERAVLMGDYLYATAFTLLSRLGTAYVMEIMSDVCQQLCRGELREVEARFRLDLTEEEYFEIIRDKTASLIGGCCQSGAYLAGYPPETVRQFADFGIKFGLAFQIIDDCLDLTGDQRQMGKSVLADLDKGALSLPMIYLTQQLSARERDRLFAPLRERSTDPAFLALIAKEAEASGAIAKAEVRARAMGEAAVAALSAVSLPAHKNEGQAGADGLADAWHQLTEYAVSRRS